VSGTPRQEIVESLLGSYLQDLRDLEDLITAFRLYKSGDFRLGHAWFLLEFPSLGGTDQIEVRAKEADVRFGPGGFGQEKLPDRVYTFEADDRAAFVVFDQRWKSVVPALQKFPRFKVALAYYNESYSDKSEAAQLLVLMVTLEALLVNAGEGLSYHLAVRCANLLGSDAGQRKRIFKEAKDFYDLRSKLVHSDV
jgi:hypothetical protein